MSNLFSSGVRPAIDDWLLEEARKSRDYGDYWSASSAGYCMRKLIFERLGVPHVEKDDDARKQRVFTSGHIFHEWIQATTKKAGISIAQEVELQDEDLMVRGHFDDLILIKEPTGEIEAIGYEPDVKDTPVHVMKPRLILYDYKTRNSRSFNFAKSPSYFHRLQLGTYMYMLRKIDWDEFNPEYSVDPHNLTEARTLNIEKDTLRMAEVQYLWDDQLAKDVIDYWLELNTHWNQKTLPKCTCADHENGFMAKEKFNPYFYDGEPCSVKLYQAFKKEQSNV